MLGIGHHVCGHALAVYGLGFVLAEVHAADQFPRHHEVNAFRHDVPAQRARAGQLREQLGRAHIGEQAHGAADAQQALFRPLVPGHAVPLGAAHRAQQHAVRLKAGVDGRLGQGRAVVVDGHAADINKIIGEMVAVF